MVVDRVNSLQNNQYVIFSIDREDYGISIMDVKAIESYPLIKPIPNASKNIVGITNLKDEVIPVYSLRRKFSLEELSDNNEERVIITKFRGLVVAYLVDKITGVMELPREELNIVPQILKTKDTAYIKWIAKKDGNLIVLLDQDNVLDRNELEIISEISFDN